MNQHLAQIKEFTWGSLASWSFGVITESKQDGKNSLICVDERDPNLQSHIR